MTMKDEERRKRKRDLMREYRKNNPDYVARCSEHKARQAQRRKYWLGKYKVSKGCTQCGYNGHPSALDFDHLEPSLKSFHIAATLTGRSLKSIIKEVRKCRILCANCHRVHSYNEAQHRKKYK